MAIKTSGIAVLRQAPENSTEVMEDLLEDGYDFAIEQIRENKKALAEPTRNCDNPLAKDLIGAVTLYCTENPGLPPMVEWNAVQYLGFCRWLFGKDDGRRHTGKGNPSTSGAARTRSAVKEKQSFPPLTLRVDLV